MIRVLLLATYPIKNPRHGGQIRINEIIKKYQVHNITTKFVAIHNIYEDSHHIDKDDIGVDLRGYENNILIGDLIICQKFAASDIILQKLARVMSKFQPNFIHIEQPWLFPCYKALCNRNPQLKCKLIYSSQNIEYRLKANILREFNYKDGDSITQDIKDLEAKVCKEAYLTIAVTNEDAAELKDFGASRVIVAPNATSLKTFNEDMCINSWKKRINQKNFAVFIGSGHPPNVTGFMNMLGPAFGFLSPEQKIVICGGAGQAIYNYDFGIFNLLNQRHIISVGIISDRDLDAIIKLSSIILLPITEKAGSNLKTAEAILSGKIIIGTSIAFRGYEEYKNEPFVIIADTAEEFKNAIKECLAKDLTNSSDRSEERFKKLLWGYSLEIIPNTILEG